MAFVAFVVAGVLSAAVAAAPGTWATQADTVRTSWQAKSKALLKPQPKTRGGLYLDAEGDQGSSGRNLPCLPPYPSQPPKGKAALASVRRDIAEIELGAADWCKGDKAGFARVFTAWQNDHRPHRAFLAAGAKACD